MDQLRTYNVIHPTRPDSPQGLSISLINDVKEMRRASISWSKPLPPVSLETSAEDVPEPEPHRPRVKEPWEEEDDDYELPPKLRPTPIDDDIQQGDPPDDL